MALLPNASVTYGDLITEAYNKIIALVQNRDAYSNAVPAEIKAGYKKTTTITLDHALNKPVTYTFVMPTDPRLAVVSTQQINTDWNNFLTSRGLSSQANQPISTRGILNLYNNIAAFCSVKLILVTSQLTSTECVFYNPVDTNYPDVPSTDPNEYITYADITELLDVLSDTINSVTKLYIARYNITTASCSCSSSSSSSSSSCSCSSSSSIFIAYFKL